MSFSSPLVLFYFLPLFFLFFFLIPDRFRKVFLLLGSVLFYFGGEPLFFLLILILVLLNYCIGKTIDKAKEKNNAAVWWLIGGCSINLAILLFFKSYTHLPVGLSFMTFQTIAYLIDIYKNRTPAVGSLFDFSLFVFLFPKVVSGPIVTYRELNPRLQQLKPGLADAANGFRRFSMGLAKKVIIADTLSSSVNRIFDLSAGELTTPWAWFGMIGFAIQIYFDFSGYTDMAIGLGQVLGLKLPENFNYPYFSRSITEFWRRWHITLSNWFRDYLFYPLERKRKTSKRGYQFISVLTVFSLTGLWHGLTWSFLAWGLLQGILITFEQSEIGKKLIGRLPLPLQHAYGLTTILFGWVLFRTANLSQAGWYFAALFGFANGHGVTSFYSMPIIETDVWIILLIGILLSFPIVPFIQEHLQKYRVSRILGNQFIVDILILVLVFISATFILSSGGQMNLYAKF